MPMNPAQGIQFTKDPLCIFSQTTPTMFFTKPHDGTFQKHSINPIRHRRQPIQLILQPPILFLRLPLPPANEPDLLPQRLQPPRDGHLLRHGERLERAEGVLGLGEVPRGGYDAFAQRLLALLVAAEVEGELLLDLSVALGGLLDLVLNVLMRWRWLVTSREYIFFLKKKKKISRGRKAYIKGTGNGCHLLFFFVIVVAAQA